MPPERVGRKEHVPVPDFFEIATEVSAPPSRA